MSKRTIIVLSTLLLASLACMGGNDDTADTEPPAVPCTEMDPPEGEYLNLMGDWTGDFATEYFHESCGDLTKQDFNFMEGAVEIDGYVPDGIKIIFQGNRDERLRGTIHPNGGVVFAGQRPSTNGELHIAMGGLAYDDERIGHRVIQGYAYIGVDTDEDGTIDCEARGDWKAIKSGV